MFVAEVLLLGPGADERDGEVHRALHPAVTEMMASPGRRNEALSGKMWFECTSDRKERCTAPYASTHHIIYLNEASHRRPPLLLSDRQSQSL